MPRECFKAEFSEVKLQFVKISSLNVCEIIYFLLKSLLNMWILFHICRFFY